MRHSAIGALPTFTSCYIEYMNVYARRAIRPYIACMSARGSEHTYRLLDYSFTRLLGASTAACLKDGSCLNDASSSASSLPLLLFATFLNDGSSSTNY